MIYEKLIPEDHLLVRIDSIMDFSFVYDIVKSSYSSIGRKSEDPVVLFKLNLLEYLYKLSYPAVITRAQTDVAIRWFLGLNLDDELPDDSLISYFRIHRMGEKGFEDVFNEVVKRCIENNLVGKRRYMVDLTNVDANVNYPSMRRLICNAFRTFAFDKKSCTQCSLREQCLYANDLKKSRGRVIKLSTKYDAVMKDMHRISTDEFKIARNKRYKIERRFATMVRNHGLRRSRFLRLPRTKIHIILANTACNIIRMVNLLWNNLSPSFAIPK